MASDDGGVERADVPAIPLADGRAEYLPKESDSHRRQAADILTLIRSTFVGQKRLKTLVLLMFSLVNVSQI